MNTYLTVNVNASSAKTIRCAYNTLLSFETVYDSYLKENIHTAYAAIAYNLNYRGKPLFKRKMDLACIIIISTAAEHSCTMQLTVNTAGIAGVGVDSAGKTHEFAAEFLKRFSETLEETNA